MYIFYFIFFWRLEINLNNCTAAPFGLITASRRGAISTFNLPPASFFATSLFGRGQYDNGYIVGTSLNNGGGNNNSSSQVEALPTLLVLLIALTVYLF